MASSREGPGVMKNRGGRKGKASAYAVTPEGTNGRSRSNAFYSQEGKERYRVSACTDTVDDHTRRIVWS